MRIIEAEREREKTRARGVRSNWEQAEIQTNTQTDTENKRKVVCFSCCYYGLTHPTTLCSFVFELFLGRSAWCERKGDAEKIEQERKSREREKRGEEKKRREMKWIKVSFTFHFTYGRKFIFNTIIIVFVRRRHSESGGNRVRTSDWEMRYTMPWQMCEHILAQEERQAWASSLRLHFYVFYSCLK